MSEETVQEAVPETVAAPETPSPENAALEAFAKGVEKTGKDPEPAPAPGKADEPVKAEKAEPEPQADADADADIEKEIKARGLKTDSAERFRELAKRPDADTFAKVQALADRAEQWETTVRNTGASPEQFQATLSYLTAINSGDPKLMSAVYENLVKEVAWLGGQLGKEVPGVHDPLTAHPDLKQDVDNGDLSRARALEIANQRAMNARSDEFRQRTEQENQQRALLNQVYVDVGALNTRLQTSDPQFDQKIQMLMPTLQFIRANLPPQRWTAAIEQAYLALPAIPNPVPVPKPSGVPLRPTGSNAAAMVQKPKDAFEAFQLGVQQVSRA